MGSFIFMYMSERFTIQDWTPSERPREKFLEKGAASLSDAEVLAILIRSGNRNDNAIDLARKILAEAGNNLQSLRKFTYKDYRKFKGIGAGKALSIMAAFELASRCELQMAPVMARIHSSEMAASTIVPILRDLSHEECWVLYLNKGNRLLGKERISLGGLDATVVDTRLIIKGAIERGCCQIILAHNHPSGSCTPGSNDKIVTERLAKAAQLCDIALVDHLVIGGGDYFSFADEGLL